VPVKSIHAAYDESQRSLFAQSYPRLEIVVVAADRSSPASEVAQQIARDFPDVESRFIHSDCTGAASPKLNNLWPAIREARNDLVLTKDSNVRMAPGELESLARQMAPEVGLVSTISIATEPRSLAAWIEVSIINCYHGRILMLADAAGLGFGLGKVMLFRRSDVTRAGGFARLAWALGEDMALARAVQGLGLRTVLADRVSKQPLGARHFSDLWQRQLRWMLIWRIQLPAAYIADLLGSALPTAIAGALAAAMLGCPPVFVLAGTMVFWFCVESVLCALKGWPLSIWSPLAFVGREILTPMLWFRALTTTQVMWSGQLCRARRWPGNARFSEPAEVPLNARECDR
jgi:ceramide glucosyltransferase